MCHYRKKKSNVNDCASSSASASIRSSLFLLVFSTDDRVTSASTFTEKTNKNISNSQHVHQQSKQELVPSSPNTKPTDVDFLSRNIERVRMASLRNKYDLSFSFLVISID